MNQGRGTGRGKGGREARTDRPRARLTVIEVACGLRFALQGGLMHVQRSLVVVMVVRQIMRRLDWSIATFEQRAVRAEIR